MSKMIDEVNRLHESGVLKKLMAKGLVSPKLEFYRTIANEYNEAPKPKGRKTQVVFELSQKHKVSERTIYKACKAFF